jgi:hypothetical protein
VDILYNEQRLEALIEASKDIISFDEARKAYGIPKESLSELARAHLISYALGPQTILRPGLNLSNKSIQALIARIDERATDNEVGVGSRLRDTIRGCRTENQHFIILKALVEGTIFVLSVDNTRSSVNLRFRVDISEVRQLLLGGNGNQGNDIIVTDAASIMRIEASTLRCLLKKLDVKVTISHLYARISYSDFECLHETYISGAEMGDRLGISATGAWRCARKAELSPAITFPELRTGLMLRKEFEQKYDKMPQLIGRRKKRGSASGSLSK